MASLGGGDRALRCDNQRGATAELRDRGRGVGERLAVEAVAVLDRPDSLAFDTGEDRDRSPVGRERVRVGVVDCARVADRGAPEATAPVADRLTPTSPIGLRRPADRAIVDRCQAWPVFHFDR